MLKKFIIVIVSLLNMATNIMAFEAGQVDIHGFISQGYLKSNHNNFLAETKAGTFEYNEIGLNFSVDLNDRLRAGIQFFARDLGPAGNDEITVDWAYADYYFYQWLGLRAGKMKMTYGLYGDIRDINMLYTSVALPQAVYPEQWRDSTNALKGAGFYGALPSSPLGDFYYEIQIGKTNLDAESGWSQYVEDILREYNLALDYMDFERSMAVGFTWEPPLEGLRTRVSYADFVHGKFGGGFSIPKNIFLAQFPQELVALLPAEILDAIPEAINTKMDYKIDQMDFMIYSLEYTWNNLIIIGEYTEMTFKGQWNLNLETSNLPDNLKVLIPADSLGWKKRPTIPLMGWYAAATYRFLDWLEMGLRYSEFYPYADDRHGKKMVARGEMEKHIQAWLKTWTLSTRFDINAAWSLKLEASYNDGFGIISPIKTPEGLERYWMLYGCKATFTF